MEEMIQFMKKKPLKPENIGYSIRPSDNEWGYDINIDYIDKRKDFLLNRDDFIRKLNSIESVDSYHDIYSKGYESMKDVKFSMTTVFQFYSKSLDVYPGKGKSESVNENDIEKFNELSKIKDWRKVLSNFFSDEFELDGKKWLSVEHFYQASKFKNDNFDFYSQFSLDSKSDISKNPLLAKSAGGKSGMFKKEMIRPISVTMDKDFNSRKDLVMYRGQMAKYLQSKIARKVLMLTHDAKLQHFSRGQPPIIFYNTMKIREILSNKEEDKEEDKEEVVMEEDKQEENNEEEDNEDLTMEEDEYRPKLYRLDMPKMIDIRKTNETFIISDNKVIITDEEIQNMIPVNISGEVQISPYYLNNRKIFIDFINRKLLDSIKQAKVEEISCKKKENSEFQLLPHQEIVKEYLNVYSPYRGLLLYHGLGSGKTCSSIAIAEGLKTDKKVIVMTPASLKTNYVQELKQCGDIYFKINQHWVFLSIKQRELVYKLAEQFSIPKEYVDKKRGIWIMDQNKEPNYKTLNKSDKISLNSQIHTMIQDKYQFIHYNGLRDKKMNMLSKNKTINPFSNKVIVIDEVHNLISMIVNKLKDKKQSISKQIYEYLLSAENCKIVMLSGTPIINYPNEIAILFNILRGYIVTFIYKLNINVNNNKVNRDYFETIFKSVTTMDYIDYKANNSILTITRNPFGFTNEGDKKIRTDIDMDYDMFQSKIESILEEHNITIISSNKEFYKALPDDKDTFNSMFINQNMEFINHSLFKKRIIGLVSYFRSAQEKLMPIFNEKDDIKYEYINMSDYQLKEYIDVRTSERKKEQNLQRQLRKNKNKILDITSTTYRIFSRLFCNFVFPSEIKRPIPNLKNVANEEQIDGNEEFDDEKDDLDDIKRKSKSEIMEEYMKEIKTALETLQSNSEQFLSKTALQMYSPKYLKILENLNEKGLHLLYSQFRTLEGIGIFRLVLLQNGYAEFKIQNTKLVEMNEEDMKKPKFLLYTGTESSEDKEMMRNVFNGTWENLPPTLRQSIEKISSNNKNGEIIKLFMITSSGAEGISLKNVKYVHIMEPYWHPVRTDQVIGRARRICSHEDLPPEERFVKVFMYLMQFTNEQLKQDISKDIINNDVSILDKRKVLTTDEFLNEISIIKKQTNSSILQNVKEMSIDCVVNNKNINCFRYGKVYSKETSYTPNYNKQERDTDENTEVMILNPYGIRDINGEQFIVNSIKDESKATHRIIIRNNKLHVEQLKPTTKDYIYIISRNNKNIIIEDKVFDHNTSSIQLGVLRTTERGFIVELNNM